MDEMVLFEPAETYIKESDQNRVATKAGKAGKAGKSYAF